MINKYLEQIKKALIEDNFDFLDTFLEKIYLELSEEERNGISYIIDETTLFLELKDDKYKEIALKMIENYKK